ncbi:MAG: NUDIX domain-containing protein [Lachnospiraceae bacterium]|nr:NUDIX domain-containing protein [Lachnospiraceae bacterium]
MENEIWNLYDENGRKSELTILRNSGDKIPEGLYHIVVEILVRHKDGTYLLMKRDPNKDVYPGYWEASAGGSAIEGEGPLIAAVRELREETGIRISSDDLVLISHTLSERSRSSFYSYYVETDCNKDSIILQEKETVDFKWVDKDGFLAFVDSDESIKTHNRRYAEYIDRLRS